MADRPAMVVVGWQRISPQIIFSIERDGRAKIF
jgi:hypothetical protein